MKIQFTISQPLKMEYGGLRGRGIENITCTIHLPDNGSTIFILKEKEKDKSRKIRSASRCKENLPTLGVDRPFEILNTKYRQ